MTAVSAEDVLRTEANTIHRGRDIGPTVNGKSLYRALYRRHSTALCLSGGGIRSASFALGAVEALAVNPRPRKESDDQGDKQAANEAKSLLSQFHYLSTVSGGGYIGSWLSAWIKRAGYGAVWSRLVGHRERPEREPSEIAWLRAYSNFLTPRIGLFSADTWTALALVVRNLILNWLVILSALCLALLGVKSFAVGAYWMSHEQVYVRPVAYAFAALGGLAMVIALSFALYNRPSNDPCWPERERKRRTGEAFSEGASDASDELKEASTEDSGDDRDDPHRQENALQRPGADETKFIYGCLAPAVIAAFLLSLYLMIRGHRLKDWELSWTVLLTAFVGMGIYALSWIVTRPYKLYACPDEPRDRRYWCKDFTAWFVAGGVYGALIGVGIHAFAKYEPFILIGNLTADRETGRFLLAMIYGVPWIIVSQLTAEMIFVGLTNWQPYSNADREWFGRSTGWFSITAAVWFAVAVIVLIAGDLLLWLVKNYDSAKYGGSLLAIGSGLFSTILGRSKKSAANDQGGKPGSVFSIAVPVAAVVFLILLVIGISMLIDYLLFTGGSLVQSSLLDIAPRKELGADLGWLAGGIVVVCVFAYVSWTRVNINRFSIHALYANRLIRGYLGASNPFRAPNPFTGFDEADNIKMSELWVPGKESWQPFHVVNVALNVVNSNRLAWQERKAEPFTITPLHCGAAELGYRDAREYGDPYNGISLGTALAISGAAASPNMGYNSSPIVTLLLALFNVRLGWWLGNPGPKGEPDYYKCDGPKLAITPFFNEMFGLTNDNRRYVYLSDGGHFENLGVYEMIRRRCRCIVICDAGADPEYGFEDLGNAVRKIAIDLGIYISFSELYEIKRRSKDNTVIKGAYYALGEIDYKTAPENTPDPKSRTRARSAKSKKKEEIENGYILYVKPSYHGTESPGIVAYAAANAAFPHESTADQFFSESQFESYRTLGFEIMNEVLRTAAQNLDTIVAADAMRGSDKATLVPGKLCDLIKALDVKTLKDAETTLNPGFKVSRTLQKLDEEDKKEMFALLREARDVIDPP